MDIGGRLTIDLGRAGDGTGRAAIASSRPLGVTRAFIGKTPDDTVRMLPLLFNVCAMAQGAASVEACERALAVEADETTRTIRKILVLAETLREHLIRAAVDWPRFLGVAAGKADMLRVMQGYEALRRALDPGRRVLAIGATARLDPAVTLPAIDELAHLAETAVFGEALEAWRSRRTADNLAGWSRRNATVSQQLVRTVLDRGWAGAGHAATSFLPPLDDGDLASRLLGPGAQAFVAAPTWEGEPRETTALARQAECPLVRDVARAHGASALLTRLAARLVEIAELPALMKRLAEHCIGEPDTTPLTSGEASHLLPGCGVAQVEAARGRLVHGVEIEDGIVCRYTVLAPTEWNFHAEGSAAHGLAEIAGRERNAREIADLFVTTVDPCVGYELRVH